MDKNFYENLIKEAKRVGIKRYVVGALIQKDSLVLLLERPKDDFMGGIYELPSGKVEDSESLDIALYREVEEETGLRIREIKRYLGHFDYEYKSRKKTRQFNFAVIVEEPIRIKLQEHDNYAWVNKNQLHLYPITDSVKKLLYLFWGE
jgi:8-oxo-dGTP diphosphatase